MRPERVRDLGLALRLLRGAGRREGVRLAAMAAGVALATTAVLVGLAGPRVAAAEHRTLVARSPYLAPAEPGSDGLGLQSSTALLDDRTWTRVDLSGAASGAPRPPGVEAWPAPGHALVSPALAALLDRDPTLRASLGVVDPTPIGRAGLTGSDELLSYASPGGGGAVAGIADVGSPRGTSRAAAGERLVVTGFGNPATVGAAAGSLSGLPELVLLVGLPALVFLTTALRLSVAARADRSFVLGLVGLTPTRAARLFATEMTVVAAAGYLLGTAVYAVLQAPLGASGLTGVRWWPEQARASTTASAVLGVLLVLGVRALARRSMRRSAARSRADRAEGRRGLPTGVVAAPGLVALGFLLLVDVRGLAHASSAWMGDGQAARVSVAVVVLVLAVVLAAPRLVRSVGSGRLEAVPPTVALGLRGAAARAGSSGRLVAFVAVTVVLAGVSAAYLGALERSAEGDPRDATLTFSVADVAARPHWLARLPAGEHLVRTGLSGASGRYDVVVGDCPAVERASAAVYADPGPCVDAVQRGEGGLGGATVTALRVGARAVSVPSAPVTPRVLYDLKFPSAQAPWLASVRDGDVTYWASRADGSYDRVLAALTAAYPGLRIEGGVRDPQRAAAVRPHLQSVRVGSALGLLLCAAALALAALEGRWERMRSLTALAALGLSARRQRTAAAIEFGVPVLIGAVPAAVAALVGGAAVASFFGSDGMLSAALVGWTVGSAVLCVVVSAGLGWCIGAVRFRRESLART